MANKPFCIIGETNPLDEFGYQDTLHPKYKYCYDAEWVINSLKATNPPKDDLLEMREYWFHQWNFVESSTDNHLAYRTICDILNTPSESEVYMRAMRGCIKGIYPSIASKITKEEYDSIMESFDESFDESFEEYERNVKQY